MSSYVHRSWSLIKMTGTMENFTGKVFSFAEIIQDRDHVVKVSDDGFLYAIDLVMVMTGKDRDVAGKILRRLPDDLFQSNQLIERRPKRGGHPIKLISFSDAIELVMVLPGKKAKKVKSKFADIIRRYLAGDHALVSEINCNATSLSPVAQLARESMKCPSIEKDNITGVKRGREKEERETLVYYENIPLAKQMGFVEKAFECQKTALYLSEHENSMEQNKMILVELIEMRNYLLEEIKAIEESDKELDLEIQTTDLDYINTKLELDDSIKTIRILSNQRIESDYLE